MTCSPQLWIMKGPGTQQQQISCGHSWELEQIFVCRRRKIHKQSGSESQQSVCFPFCLSIALSRNHSGSKAVLDALFKALLSFHWLFVLFEGVMVGKGGGLHSPTGVCPPLLVTSNALITQPKAGDVCLLGPEGS